MIHTKRKRLYANKFETQITPLRFTFLPPKPEKHELEEEDVVWNNSTRVSDHIYRPFHGSQEDAMVQHGCLGYVRHVSNEIYSSEVTYISPQDVVNYICNPSPFHIEVKNMVLVKKDGTFVAGFLPSLTDLAMLPKVLKVVLLNQLQRSEEIPDVLKKLLVACSPRLPLERQVRVLQRGEKGVFYWNCFSNASKVYHFGMRLSWNRSASILIRGDAVSSSARDGTRYSFSVIVSKRPVGSYSNKHNYEHVNHCVNILVWNCLGATRSSFMTNLCYLMDEHCPNLVVLLETRTSEEMLKMTLAPLNLFSIVTSPHDESCGGVAILSVRASVHFSETWNEAKSTSGLIIGKKMDA